MTFLIIAEYPARAAGLAKRIKEESAGSFCSPVTLSVTKEALRTIRVDCVICTPAPAAALILGNTPPSGLWKTVRKLWRIICCTPKKLDEKDAF